jgi:hypothetical protein
MAVIRATKVFFFERTIACFGSKRAVVSTDPGEVHSPAIHDRNIEVFSREENPGAIEGDVRCLEMNDARCLEVSDSRCLLYPRPATPALLNECRLSFAKEDGRSPPVWDLPRWIKRQTVPPRTWSYAVTKCGVIVCCVACAEAVRWFPRGAIVRRVVLRPSSNHSRMPQPLVPRSQRFSCPQSTVGADMRERGLVLSSSSYRWKIHGENDRMRCGHSHLTDSILFPIDSTPGKGATFVAS